MIGNTITTNEFTTGSEFGLSVDISSDGTIISVGAYGHNESAGFLAHGIVQVFKNIDNVWTQIGESIWGENSQDFAVFTSLNSDGNVLAIGAYGNDDGGDFSGHVRVFENVNNVWTQIGSSIAGTNSGDWAGKSLSLNSNGNIVAVGSPFNDDDGIESGHVRVYENINNVWTQIGSAIVGENSEDRAGSSVSLNSSGNIIAIGSPGKFANEDRNGYASIFKNIAGEWIQIGSNIYGENIGDNTGFSISLNSIGNIIVIGSPHNDNMASNSGKVEVFENIEEVWTQVGTSITGINSGDKAGYSVSINSNGNSIAIGSPYNGYNGGGSVRVFDEFEGIWTQINYDIEGQNYNDNFGRSVSLNSIGNTFVVGSPFADSNVGYSFNGIVNVYNYINILNVTENDLEQGVHLYPNPTNNFSYMKLGEVHEQININIFDSYGKLIKSNIYNNTDLIKIESSEWAAGIYFIKIITQEKTTSAKLILSK